MVINAPKKGHFLSYRMGRRDAMKRVYMCVLRHSGQNCQLEFPSAAQAGSPHDDPTLVKGKCILKLFLYINPFSQVIPQKQSLHKHKTKFNFGRVSPFNITLVKRVRKARTCWYCRPFRLIYRC